jgi:hypothetical protein
LVITRLSGGPSSVDQQRRAGGKFRCVRSKVKDGSRDFFAGADVSANKGCRASVLGDLRDDVRTFLFATAGDDDFRARFCKGQRCSFADTGGAPVTSTIC